MAHKFASESPIWANRKRMRKKNTNNRLLADWCACSKYITITTDVLTDILTWHFDIFFTVICSPQKRLVCIPLILFQFRGCFITNDRSHLNKRMKRQFQSHECIATRENGKFSSEVALIWLCDFRLVHTQTPSTGNNGKITFKKIIETNRIFIKKTNDKIVAWDYSRENNSIQELLWRIQFLPIVSQIDRRRFMYIAKWSKKKQKGKLLILIEFYWKAKSK